MKVSSNSEAYSYFLNKNSLFNVAMDDAGWEWVTSKAVLDRLVVSHWPDITHNNTGVNCRKALPNLVIVEVTVGMSLSKYIAFSIKCWFRNRELDKEAATACRAYLNDSSYSIKVICSRRSLDLEQHS
jgi:hypothetical protein